MYDKRIKKQKKRDGSLVCQATSNREDEMVLA